MPADVRRARPPAVTAVCLAAVALAALVLLLRAAGHHHKRVVDLPVDPAIPIAPASADLALPRLTDYRLPNGLRVLLVEDHRLPRFEATMTIDAGEVRAPYRGVAELTAKMLLEGTVTRSADEQAAAAADLGAEFASAADKDVATVRIYGLAGDAPALLDLLADAVQHPAFQADRLNERIAAWPARDSYLGRSGALTQQIADVAIYGSGPYSRPYARTEDVTGLVPSDLVAFHHRWYRPGNAVLVVVGDVDVPSVRRRIATLFAGWTPSSEAVAVPDCNSTASRPDDRPRIHLVDWSGNRDVWLTYEAPTVTLSDPDYAALRVIAHLLDWQLFEDLRESRGLTYDASSIIATPARRAGIWIASTNVPVSDAETTIRDVDAALTSLRAGEISPAELDQAKRVAIGQLSQALEQRNVLGDWYITDVRAGLPADFIGTLPERMARVSAADVQRVAGRYLTPSRLQIVVIGPRRRLESTLRNYGVVSLYDGTGKLLVQ